MEIESDSGMVTLVFLLPVSDVYIEAGIASWGNRKPLSLSPASRVMKYGSSQAALFLFYYW